MQLKCNIARFLVESLFLSQTLWTPVFLLAFSCLFLPSPLFQHPVAPQTTFLIFYFVLTFPPSLHLSTMGPVFLDFFGHQNFLSFFIFETGCLCVTVLALLKLTLQTRLTWNSLRSAVRTSEFSSLYPLRSSSCIFCFLADQIFHLIN